jgi:hypothetical protein
MDFVHYDHGVRGLSPAEKLRIIQAANVGGKIAV